MPASLLDQGVNTFSGPMVISPDGKDQYVLYSISTRARNLDRGHAALRPDPRHRRRPPQSATAAPSPTSYAVVSPDDSSVNGAIFPWGTVDAAGNVYVLYNSDAGSPGHFHTYYVVSTDKAAPGRSRCRSTARRGPGRGDLRDRAGRRRRRPRRRLVRHRDGDERRTTPDGRVDRRTSPRCATPPAPSPASTGRRSLPDAIHKGSICLDGLLCITGGDRSLADFFELVISPADGMAQIAYADNDQLAAAAAGSSGPSRPSGRSALEVGARAHGTARGKGLDRRGGAPTVALAAADRAPCRGGRCTTMAVAVVLAPPSEAPAG